MFDVVDRLAIYSERFFQIKFKKFIGRRETFFSEKTIEPPVSDHPGEQEIACT